MNPFLYVSTVIRGSNDRERTGFFYKIDWRSKQVIAKLPVPPRVDVLGSRGGSRGGRGMAVFDELVYAATFDKILIYDTEYRLQRALSHPLVIGHHEIQVDASGIWCCSTLIDAFIKLGRDGLLQDACFLSEEKALIDVGHRRIVRNRFRNYLADAETDDAGWVQFKEQFHINTVTLQPDGTVHGFATNTSYLLCVRPNVRILAHLPHLQGAHNVQMVSGELFVNHTRARAFQIYAPGESSKPRVHVPLDDDLKPSAILATSGWIRGLCWIARDLVVVGTSPAALLSIDLNTMRVAERLQLEPDVTHVVHGLTSGPY